MLCQRSASSSSTIRASVGESPNKRLKSLPEIRSASIGVPVVTVAVRGPLARSSRHGVGACCECRASQPPVQLCRPSVEAATVEAAYGSRIATEPCYGRDLALVHQRGYAFHADACAPGILALLEPVRENEGLVLELGCGARAAASFGGEELPRALVAILGRRPEREVTRRH